MIVSVALAYFASPFGAKAAPRFVKDIANEPNGRFALRPPDSGGDVR